MKLGQQILSLGLAKKLMELGVKQESLFWYQGSEAEFEREGGYALTYVKQMLNPAKYINISAFTVAELEILLPSDVFLPNKNGKKRSHSHHRIMRRVPNGYMVAYRSPSYQDAIDIREETFADALGAMLVKLLENKLIEK